MNMVETALVGLRDSDEAKTAATQAKVVLYLKVDPVLKEYAERAGRSLRGGYTEFVTDTILFYRDLDARLTSEVPRIREFARSLGLNMGTDLAHVLAELVKVGLDHQPNGHKNPKK